jgi:hypothetical protein
MSISLFDVFSSRTVEPNRPSWETPTAIRGTLSDESLLKTVFFFIILHYFGAKIQRIYENTK